VVVFGSFWFDGSLNGRINKKSTIFAKNADFFLFRARPPMQTVLTIAGFDPSSGAGVTADLMVFAAHGLFGTSCITALTVQSTVGVRCSYPVARQIVGETLECLDADIRPSGIKIGMISTEDNLLQICTYIEQLRVKHAGISEGSTVPVVVDPVVRSSSGRELLDVPGVTALRDRLLPLVGWVTPNLEELSILSGQPVWRREDVPEACRVLQARVLKRHGERRLGIVATGGHLDPPDDLLLMPDGESLWLPGRRVETQSAHGTGCAFSSAFLSRLVLGDSPQEAAKAAKRYVAGALRNAEKIGSGSGPMRHLWPLVKPID
jgi:hydroxymethylpyrimidine/phosphomethylpyrimidine kinase